MSRYVLLPGESKNLFVLVCCEDLNQTHTIEVPEELYDMDIFNNVNNRNTANNILYRICKSVISKTMDGFVKDRNSKCNLQFDEAVINCCNNIFKEYLKSFTVFFESMVLYFKMFAESFCI